MKLQNFGGPGGHVVCIGLEGTHMGDALGITQFVRTPLIILTCDPYTTLIPKTTPPKKGFPTLRVLNPKPFGRETEVIKCPLNPRR